MENDEPPRSDSTDPLVQALISVWQQVMVEHHDQVELGGRSFPVSATRGKRLRKVDFMVDHREITGIEQNPRTTSRWAQMARRGALVMQFKEGGHYLANVADGKLTFY